MQISDLDPPVCMQSDKPPYTFKQLKTSGITSDQLLSWNNNIDLADLYHLYVVHNLEQLANQTICKCPSSLFFGDLCQYESNLLRWQPLPVVQPPFDSEPKEIAPNLSIVNFTCYPGLPTCKSHISCLDWRQTCDGVIDCMNGEDEERCLEMEMNECNDETEFRCKDGRCIPEGFAFDRTFDCLDHSDEQEVVGDDLYYPCNHNPTVECEERNKAWHQFSCGDGEVLSSSSMRCLNRRDDLVVSYLFTQDSTSTLDRRCFEYMFCKTAALYGLVFDDKIGHLFCVQLEAEQLLSTCPSMYFFPSKPILFPFVRFLFIPYIMNPSEPGYLPSYVCYYTRMCPNMRFSLAIVMHNISYRCFKMNEHSLLKFVNRWRELVFQTYSIFSSCNFNYIENASSTLYQCAESSKYISKHRLRDGFSDCHLGDDETFVDTCALSLTHRFQCLSNDKKCLPRNMLLDSIWDCVDGSDELYPFNCKHSDDFGCKLIRSGSDSPLFGSYVFQELCNGIQWSRLSINNETDETNCVEWPYHCNSPYVLCDGIWNCKDGRDEINCSSYFMPVPNCFEHYCRDINNSTKLKCLPLEKAGDHVIDCLG
jgi:hypothetical protein